MTYQAEVTEIQYQDPARNSSKFYRAYRLWDDDTNDHRVLFQWGRIGSRGQNQVNLCTSEGMADSMIMGKLSDKEAKGYHFVYNKVLPGVPEDLLHLAGVSTDANGRSQRPQDPMKVLLLDIDTCRRLAMGDSEQVTEAIVLRKSITEQLSDLRHSVEEAEGQTEVLDMVLAAKVG